MPCSLQRHCSTNWEQSCSPQPWKVLLYNAVTWTVTHSLKNELDATYLHLLRTAFITYTAWIGCATLSSIIKTSSTMGQVAWRSPERRRRPHSGGIVVFAVTATTPRGCQRNDSGEVKAIEWPFPNSSSSNLVCLTPPLLLLADMCANFNARFDAFREA